MLEERGEVRTGAERAELEVGACALAPGRVSLCLRFIIGDVFLRQDTRQDADTGLRILHVARRFAREMLQSVTALDVEKSSAVGVRIDVQSRLGLELGGVRFGPFGGAQETGFLPVPARVHQGAARPPALLVQPAARISLP